MRILFAFLLISAAFQSCTRTPAKSTLPHVGVKTIEYYDENRKRPVLVEFWYPTEQSGPVDQPSDPVWVHPSEVRDVPVAKGKYPLVMMSHGHGGDRRYLSWLAGHLVEKGFVVASVEHYGNSWKSYHPLLTLRFWERAKDVTFALNRVMNQPELKGQIDPNRIGFVGYSLGGMTGLALGGAKVENIHEIIEEHQDKFKELDSELVSKIDFSEAHADFKEPRIKAMVLLSPAAFVFSPQSLKQIKIPVALVTSKGDEVLPFNEHAHKVITNLVPAKLKMLQDKVSHYVFINRVSDSGKEVLSQEIQTDEIQNDRLTVHKEVASFVAEFFSESLSK